MQKIAILADVHGNLPALEAVLAEIATEGIERIICLGDLATLGPQPHEVIARLRGLECPVVMGNTDADLLALQRTENTTGSNWGNDDFDFDWWCAAQLSSLTAIWCTCRRFSQRSACHSATG